MLSPTQEAAVAVRRCAVKFATLGFDFTSCMTKIAHLNPPEIIKLLNLDDCETRIASIVWKVKANTKIHEGAVQNCATKVLVKYDKHCPECFDPFSVQDYAPDREQIWWLMTKEQRLSLGCTGI